MRQGSTNTDTAGTGLFAGDAWFDPIEAGIRERVRGFIQELLRKWPWMNRLSVYAAFGTSMTSYPRLLRRWTSLVVERLRATWSR